MTEDSMEQRVRKILDDGGHGSYTIILNGEYWVDGSGLVCHEPGANHNRPARITGGIYLGEQTNFGFILHKENLRTGGKFCDAIEYKAVEELSRNKESLQPKEFRKPLVDRIAADPNAIFL